MRYPLTFYVKQLPPDVGGCANAFVIRILDKYKDDYGIHEHEIAHVGQWAVLFAIGCAVAAFHYVAYANAQIAIGIAGIGFSAHGLMYRFIEPYRLHCEVEAYRVQAACYHDDRRKLFASYLAKYYNLNITPEEAEHLLRS